MEFRVYNRDKKQTMPVCLSCESSVPDEKYLETYTAPFNNQEYKLYQCPKCDLQWWEPLKIVPEFYEQEGEEGYAIFHMGIDRTIGENHKMFFKHMPLKSGRLLDVGCGDGVFLVEAQKRGYEVWGIDFDRKSIQVCREKRGLKNTFAMTPQEFAEFCQKEGLRFDVITFFEVLEHQDKPREFLEAIKSMLKPGGWIAGSVPNRESLIFHIQSRKITKGDYPPNHFLRFTKNSLYNLFEQSKFKLIDIVEFKSLVEAIVIVQTLIFGSKLGKFFRKLINKSEYVGEGCSLFDNLPTWRKFTFKSLKSIRNLVFLPLGMLVYFISRRTMMYFKANIEN